MKHSDAVKALPLALRWTGENNLLLEDLLLLKRKLAYIFPKKSKPNLIYFQKVVDTVIIT